MLLRTGGCYCGSVRFAADLVDEKAAACHCHQCQRLTGHYWAYVTALSDAISFQADGTLSWFHTSEQCERGFCGHCGSLLFRRRTGEKVIAISVGSLDETVALRLTDHEFALERPGYYPLPVKAQLFRTDRSDPSGVVHTAPAIRSGARRRSAPGG
ncbi:MAG: GFA family protein [Neomegalonema sp.]|nr:GFA family protein [Neomegalonema sp.]